MSEDVPGIVVEPGTRTTRFGVAGDTSPQVITDTSVLKSGTDVSFEVPSSQEGRNSEVWSPLVDGIVMDFDTCCAHWQHLANKHLGMDISEQPLTVTEEVWTPKGNRAQYFEAAFETLNAPAFQLMKSPLAAAFQSGRTTALVVNAGAASASAVPVIDGVVRQQAETHTNFAGDFLDAHTLAQLETAREHFLPLYMVNSRRHGVNRQESTSVGEKGTESYFSYQLTRMLADLKRVTCLVSATPLRGPEIRGTKQYELPSGYEVLLGSERVAIAEPLFQPSLFPLNDMSVGSNALGLSEIAYHAMQKADAPPEIMTNLASNIVLHGGTSQLNGVVLRLENDLKNLMPNSNPVVNALSDHPVWSGASIFASLGEFHESSWVTRQQYEEQGAQYIADN